MTRSPAGESAPATRLRVVVEGLCLAGKSTLVAALAPLLDAHAVPEYADLAPLPPWPPADTAAARTGLEHLAAVERTRQHTAVGHRAVVFDRCPLSLAAHEAGMRAIGVPADPAYAARLFAAQCPPDAVLHLTVPEAVARTRQRERGPLPEHLVDPAVRAAIAAYYAVALARLPGRTLHLDGTAPPSFLLGQVQTFLRRLPSCPPGRWPLPVPETARSTP